ncbi:MAG: hypothetical protein Tsb0033_10000 [Winogradskyella sp.]
MLKRTLLLTFFAVIIFSCSNDDEDQNFQACIDEMVISNEFIYRCNTYRTDSGRINMNNSPSSATTPCIIELINTEYSDFDFEDGDENINIINIWVNIPSEYYQLQELPEGTYSLGSDNNPDTLDITTLFRVGPNVRIYQDDNYNSDSLLISGLVLGNGDELNQAELTVTKINNDIYEIKYFFEATNGILVKGHYEGPLGFVDNWL